MVVMAGLIGDTVMSTPVLMEAKHIWPEAEIVLLGGAISCELLKGSPMLTAVKEASADPFSLRGRRQISALMEWIRRQNFDIGIILLGDQFAYALAQGGIPVRVGVHGHVLEPCLTHAYDIGSPRTWGPRERLNSLRCLGYEVRDVAPMLWVEDAARESAAAQLARLGLSRESPYAILHPFGSTRRQWWPVERVVAVAEGLSRHGVRTVVAGGPEVRASAPGLPADRVANAVGELSIAELVAAIHGASIVVSTDSGPFHIGGALGRPLLGLFRARRPEHGRRYPHAEVLFGRDALCDIRCAWDSCRLDACAEMASLSAEEVISAAGKILGLGNNRFAEAEPW
jgi:ADP-heptose:LPS heptosyltransferase